MKEIMEYPAMRYHPEKSLEGIVCRSAEHDAALGAGWVEEPSQFPKVVKPAQDPVEAAPALATPAVIESKKPRMRKAKT